MIIPQNCPRYPYCEKLAEIETLNPAVYDIEGLTGDICWLCDRKEKAGDNGTSHQLSFVGERSSAPRYMDNLASESHPEGLTFAIWRIII